MGTGNCLWLEKLSSTYWAIDVGMIPVIESVINNKLSGAPLKVQEEESTGESLKYRVIGDTAIIPIHGVILKKKVMMEGLSGLVPVLDVEATFQEAMADSNISRVILDVDSPGGTVEGLMELSDLIYESRGKGKEIISYANGSMCSAAYWLGSSADKVYGYATSHVGSIGVYTLHTDQSVFDANRGIRVTVISAGEEKTVGNPHEPLSASDRELIQERINFVHDLFMSAVARNRGMSAKSVKAIATGRVFFGEEAVSLGLIDGIKNFNGLIDESNLYSFLRKEETPMLTAEQLKAENPALFESILAQGRLEAQTELQTELQTAKTELQTAKDQVKIITYAVKLGLSEHIASLTSQDLTFEAAVEKMVELKAASSESLKSPASPADFYSAVPPPAGSSGGDEDLGAINSKEAAHKAMMSKYNCSKADAWRKAREEYPQLFQLQ